MAVKKKAPAKKSAAPRGKIVKTARRAATKKSPAKKAKRKSARRESALERVENALLTTVAEVDEWAADLGLAGAVPPKSRKKKAR